MHFSCKISNAIISLLEDQNEDLGPLYEQMPLPIELLRDPSYWLSAPDMELFLESVLKLNLNADCDILRKAGHDGPTLRAWGVLDSVLRMMPRPEEIFNKPEQFLSYFISPKPPVDNLRREGVCISFDLPLPAEQYPLVTTYLQAAFESLPVYVGQPLAQCDWQGIRVQLNWSAQQNSIFTDSVGHQVSPDLFQSLIEDLQNTQREREDLQKYIGDLEERLRDNEKRLVQAKTSAQNISSVSVEDKVSLIPHESPLANLNFEGHSPSHTLNQNLARMHDYMVRAQQLITMLVAQGKMNASVKEAMRRVDWEYVKNQYPQTVFESMELVKKINRKPEKEGIQNV